MKEDSSSFFKSQVLLAFSVVLSQLSGNIAPLNNLHVKAVNTAQCTSLLSLSMSH